MKHVGTKPIETKRLILRPFVREDAQSMFTNWASDPEVTKYLTWPTHGSVEISAMVLGDWVSHYGEENYYQWAIVPKDLGQPIGSIAAVNVKDAVDSVEIGYCIGTQWWHRGYTSEALQAVMDFFFDRVGANRVEARHDSRNPNSGKVMKKCGMTCEGVLRQSDRNNQGVCDAVWYSLLASERGKCCDE